MEGHTLYGLPPKQGLYDPSFEKDACGVGFVVSIDGIRSSKVCCVVVVTSVDVVCVLFLFCFRDFYFWNEFQYLIHSYNYVVNLRVNDLFKRIIFN